MGNSLRQMFDKVASGMMDRNFDPDAIAPEFLKNKVTPPARTGGGEPVKVRDSERAFLSEKKGMGGNYRSNLQGMLNELNKAG